MLLHPPVLRAIQTVTTKLIEAGDIVLPWNPYEHQSAIDLLMSIIAADGGTVRYYSGLYDEVANPSQDLLNALNTSGEPLIQSIADLTPPRPPKLTINELWGLQLKKWKYQCAYLAKIREFKKIIGKELDAIITAIAPDATIRHNQFKHYGYTTIVNLLDFTSVVAPVMSADGDIDIRNEDFRPLSEIDETVQGECEC